MDIDFPIYCLIFALGMLAPVREKHVLQSLLDVRKLEQQLDKLLIVECSKNCVHVEIELQQKLSLSQSGSFVSNLYCLESDIDKMDD